MTTKAPELTELDLQTVRNLANHTLGQGWPLGPYERGMLHGLVIRLLADYIQTRCEGPHSPPVEEDCPQCKWIAIRSRLGVYNKPGDERHEDISLEDHIARFDEIFKGKLEKVAE